MRDLKAGKPVKAKAILTPKPANKGIHWEYRVFGVLSKEHRDHMESICSTPLESGNVEDSYLWSLGCRANIKIRRKKLKFKHLLETTPDGFELWEEGKHLKFKFPLDGSAFELLEKDLCVEAPEALKSQCRSADDLRAGVSLFKPALKFITVEKHRTRCAFMCEGAPIQLEIAELTKPAQITSIAIESGPLEKTLDDERLRHIRAARDLLALPGSFEVMGYMQFLDHLVKRDLS